MLVANSFGKLVILLTNRLFIDAKYASFRPHTHAFYLFNAKLQTAADPAECFLENADRGVAHRLAPFSSPTHRAVIDVVVKAIVMLFDIARLVAKLGKDAGDGRNPDTQFHAEREDFEGEIADTS